MARRAFALLTFLVGLILGGTALVFAAPIGTTLRSVLPESGNKFYLGTTTPSRLEWADVISQNITITNGTATTTLTPGMSFVSGSGGANMPAYFTNSSTLAATSSPTFRSFYATSTTDTSSIAGNLNIGGNVGIGTAGPGAKLEVYGTEPQLRLQRPDFRIWDVYTDNSNGLKIKDASLGQDRIMIATSGNLGIGTTTPGALLSVHNGSADIGGVLTVENGIKTGWFLATSTAINSGIGTSSPGALFAVHGPALINGTSTIIGGLLTPSISGTSTLGFYTAGAAAPRMYIDGSGNVGIGITNPTTALDLVGPVSGSASPNRGIRAGYEGGIALSGDADVMKLTYGLYTQSATTFHMGGYNAEFRSNAAGSILYMAQGGNVGIGTTSPGALLSVHNGSADIGGVLTAENGIKTGWLLATSTAINSGIGTSSPGALFSVHGPALINGTSTIIGGVLTPSLSATSSLGFYTAGAAAPRMVIDASGKVGIGTAGPQSALHVYPSADDLVSSLRFDRNGQSANQYGLLANSGAYVYLSEVSTYGGGGIVLATSNNGTVFTRRVLVDETNGGVSVGSYAHSLITAPLGGMIISGNVGIGTTSPGSMLSVQGQSLLIGTTTALGGILTPSISATSSLGFYTAGAAAPRMYIDGSGNVGIGTAGPVSPLHIYRSTAEFRIESTGSNPAVGTWRTNSDNAGLDFGVEGDPAEQILVGSVPYTAVVSNPYAYPLMFGTDGTVGMTISATNNVGIGTTAPASLLSVSPSETTATTTIHVGTKQSTTNGSCIQMYTPDGLAVKLWASNGDGTIARGGLVTEIGSCQ